MICVKFDQKNKKPKNLNLDFLGFLGF